MSTPPVGAGRRLGGSVRGAWAIVLLMMLAAAAWSISGKLMGWGMVEWLAWTLSLMFDLAGLICAVYAERAIMRGTPSGLPRLAVFGFVSVSGVLNWSEGVELGGTVGGIGLASISLAVELLFELHRRDVRDEQRAARGLVAERMPYIPLLAWVMFPALSWQKLRTAVRARLETLDTVTPPVTAVTSVDRVPDALVTPPVMTPVTAPPAPPALPSSPTPPPPPPARRPAPRPPVVPVGARQLPIVARPAASQAPVPAQDPAPIQYSDPRCAVIRALYDTVPPTRPGTAAMRAAIIAAGHPEASDGTIRGVLRAEVERYEPHLEGLPSSSPFARGA
ncbi:DUF2637 domain-containing protein [Streptomyces sp. NBC_01571]|uniref:DUF2637 domain-containing protein n=1 Tax=Streptomyces sp. NBC_01571 TaxID=2975883 RepID=UPI002255AB2B|nr:DUF2637 domain-containing protein [Streptomyces sp. NBC_01571]MCX4575633.1 DUF2637 domain-containing protein [Streptomyces sp. NBC_01571]